MNDSVSIQNGPYPHHSPQITHWGQDKVPTIFQKPFLNAFSLIKVIKFWFKFPEFCYQGSN